MKILILGTAGQGLNHRVLHALRNAGHQAAVDPASDPAGTVDLVETAKPDLVFCLLPVDRLAALPLPSVAVWRDWRTIALTVGPRATEGSIAGIPAADLTTWCVTARLLVATAGPPSSVEQVRARRPVLWHEEIQLPLGAVRRSTLYRGPVADLVARCAVETTIKASDPTYFLDCEGTVRDEPVAGPTGPRPTRLAPEVTIRWDTRPAEIVRAIRAADGSPGASTTLFGRPARVFDAHVGRDEHGCPIVGAEGVVFARHEGAVLVGTGTGSVWIGQVARPTPNGQGLKLPATTALRSCLRLVPVARTGPPPWLTYRRTATVGTLTFRPYNGALPTRACRQLLVALRYALSQPTQALILQGADDLFCTGMHLGMIDSAVDSAAEGWANARALNAVCRRICALSSQIVITALTGDAAAGGAMLGLGADVVVARQGILLHPYYGLGLSGSQLHTYSLPLRVGRVTAAQLLSDRLPIDPEQAFTLGLIDETGPADPAEFSRWLAIRAAELAAGGPTVRSAASGRSARAEAKARRAAIARRPLSYYETAELAEMARDIFDDRHGFSARRRAFLARSVRSLG